jgi:hypothetical protein
MKRYERLLTRKNPWSIYLLSDLCEPLILGGRIYESESELKHEVTKALVEHINAKDLAKIKLLVNTHFRSNSAVLSVDGAVGGDGQTALHVCAQVGFVDGIEYFMSLGANVDAVDTVNGLTGMRAVSQPITICEIIRVMCSALHVAAKWGRPSAVLTLMKYKANPRLQTINNQRCALHFAAQIGSFDCIQVRTSVSAPSVL